MEFEKFEINGLFLLKPKVFYDERGYFVESFNKNVIKDVGIDVDFLQDNESKSAKNVLRGLHFQNAPHSQGKLVRVVKGVVIDVAVDIRRNSPTYGKHVQVELTEFNKFMFFIPSGFAHGFVTLENDTIFSYKCTDFYNKESEGCILWNDADLNINWGVENPIISEKDKFGVKFNSFNTSF